MYKLTSKLIIYRNLGEDSILFRLSDICRRFANRPPKRLIFDRQLREAKRLLLFSDNAVNNIAWQLGFKDPAYFARFFNRLVGCSPSAYRAKKVPVT